MIPPLLFARTEDCAHLVSLTFRVEYTDGYPDVLPKLSLEVEQGELEDEEISQLLEELQRVVCAPPSTLHRILSSKIAI